LNSEFRLRLHRTAPQTWLSSPVHPDWDSGGYSLPVDLAVAIAELVKQGSPRRRHRAAVMRLRWSMTQRSIRIEQAA
jgi:hypothetical protein